MILLGVFAFFTLGYLVWARKIESTVRANPERKTPSQEFEDGVDYVPTRPGLLFGHHFASIAGVGPIVGPILAVQFGWLPVLLWLALGVVLIGAVHDYGALMCSVRHKGRMIGQIMGEYIGNRGKQVFSLFAVATVILVIAIFARIVAKAFVESPQAASASVLLTLFSIAIGFLNRKLRLPTLYLVPITLLFCVVAVFVGMETPLHLSFNVWFGLLAVYSLLASVLPVWSLLQPRDFSNFFLLAFFLVLGSAGIIWSRPSFQLPAFVGWKTDLGYLFPFLFVLVACGSVSGFHSLVSSGTTSKQIASEKHARVIGYGGMLAESVLGVIALFAATTFTTAEYFEVLGPRMDGAITVFSIGVSRLIEPLGLPHSFVTHFATLALSAFALTSLDTAARLARYLLQEGLPKSVLDNRYTSSGTVIVLAVLLALSGGAGILWPLFGTSNQLLAAIALLTAAMWASASKYKRIFFLIPSIFMFGVTFSAMYFQIKAFGGQGKFLLLGIALLLLGLSIYLVVKGLLFMREPVLVGRTESEP